MRKEDIKAIFFVSNLTQFSNLLFAKGCTHIELPFEVLKEKLYKKGILVITKEYKRLNEIKDLMYNICGVPTYILGDPFVKQQDLNTFQNAVFTSTREWNLFNYYFKNFNQQNFDDYISEQG